MAIDGEWFTKQIARHGSQAAFAVKIQGPNGKSLTQSAVSRTLSGERQMAMIEVRQYARVLGVPVAEVLIRAGVITRAELVSWARGLKD